MRTTQQNIQKVNLNITDLQAQVLIAQSQPVNLDHIKYLKDKLLVLYEIINNIEQKHHYERN